MGGRGGRGEGREGRGEGGGGRGEGRRGGREGGGGGEGGEKVEGAKKCRKNIVENRSKFNKVACSTVNDEPLVQEHVQTCYNT